MEKMVRTLARNGLHVLTLAAFLDVLTAHAENNSNYVFNGTTTNFGGSLSIPFTSPGTNNSLQILNGGSVTNAGGGIGLNSGDNYNYAIVSGPGSTWYNSGAYSIGSVGSYNLLLITNGGYARIASDAYVGSTGSVSNRVIVTDAGSVWSIGARLHAGYAGTAASLVITNGGTVAALQTWQGGWPGSGSHSILVTGSGSVLSNSLDFSIGVYPGSGGNQVMIANSGKVVNATGAVGGDPGGGTNVVTITGPGSIWSNTSAFYLGSGGAHANQLYVRDGGSLRSDGTIVIGYTGRGNAALVADPGSLLDARSGSIQVGAFAPNNRLTLSNGATAVSANLYIGSGNAGGSNNVLLVTGAGSLLSNTTETIVGYVGPSNRLIIANGGRVYSANATIGYYHSPGIPWIGGNSVAEVTGKDSTWAVAGTLRVGLNGITNTVLVTDSGTVEANTIVTGSGTVSTITNRGGIYQFTSATPTITPGSGAGSIMMSNATISYRNVASADINNAQVGNVAKQGNNTFQLDNSTNTSVASYTFNTGNPSNYHRLALKNGSRFQATTVTFGSGGALVGNGTVASANVTNHGTIAPGFSAGEITFTSNLVLGSTSVLAMEIGGTNPTNYDRLIVNGSLTLTGTLSIAMINAFAPTVGDTFTLIDNTGSGPVAGFFSGLTNNAFIDASGNGIDAYFRIQYDGGTGNDVVLFATVPEPSAFVFLISVCAIFLRRSRMT